MTVQSYTLSKKVYSGSLLLDKAAGILENTYGMNPASAKMYINNFKYLFEGEQYTRIMKLEDTEYYIQQRNALRRTGLPRC